MLCTALTPASCAMTGACGGVVACSTCHVVVHPSFFSKLPKPDEEELDMLDLAFGLTDWCVLASLCVQYVTRSLRLAGAALGLAVRSRWTPLWMASSLLCHRKPGMQGADMCASVCFAQMAAVGKRVSVDGSLGTVRFVGSINGGAGMCAWVPRVCSRVCCSGVGWNRVG